MIKRYQQWCEDITVRVAVLSFGVAAIFVCVMHFSLSDIAGLKAKVTAFETPSQPSSSADQLAIETLTLFGRIEDRMVTPIASDIILKGIFLGDNQNPSSALLLIDNRAIRVAVGDSLPGGGKVEAIHASSVIIERAGQLEGIVFERDKNSPF